MKKLIIDGHEFTGFIGEDTSQTTLVKEVPDSDGGAPHKLEMTFDASAIDAEFWVHVFRSTKGIATNHPNTLGVPVPAYFYDGQGKPIMEAWLRTREAVE